LERSGNTRPVARLIASRRPNLPSPSGRGRVQRRVSRFLSRHGIDRGYDVLQTEVAGKDVLADGTV
jgi:hypothetical protein